MHFHILRFLFAALVLFSTQTGFAQTCEGLFRPALAEPTRAATVPAPAASHEVWLKRFYGSPRVLYRAKHKFSPREAFLASNEFDWSRTPLDGKQSDVVIAFGTNSAWEIAVNKNAKHLVIADWAPAPLLAHAYILAPLIRISKTPEEFILHLAGKNPALYEKMPSPKALLHQFAQRFAMSETHVGALAQYFASRPEIKPDELMFLVQYFDSRILRDPRDHHFGFASGPLGPLREPIFADFLSFYAERYRQVPADMIEHSVLLNPAKYAVLRAMFVENRVSYAQANVYDKNLYQAVQKAFPTAQSWTLSLTNIFEMPYGNHSFRDFQNFLATVMRFGKISTLKPLTVFRTTNYDFPHGYYRYDLNTLSDIPRQDEADSQIPKRRGSAAGF